MNNEIPKEFDLIIVGTGLVESITSAAASRVGKTVLHIDSSDYYGDTFASFSLEAIQKQPWLTSKENKHTETHVLKENEQVFPIGNELFDIENFSFHWHVPENIKQPNKAEKDSDECQINKKDSESDEREIKLEAEETGENKNKLEDTTSEKVITKESLLNDSRKFNIDITPKLQFARGDFVELLISSNIARYAEFRSVSRVLTWLNGQLEVVPCSRSDVFANNRVSVIEKRMLMKLLTSLDSIQSELKTTNDYKNKTFKAYLKDKKLSPSLIHYVLYAISMSNDETLCLQGVQNTKRFLDSLGRFGKTPFLFSMYGSGEVSQAFCRLSAVFGGTYALSQPLNGLIFDENKTFKSLLWGREGVKAPNLVISIRRAPEMFVKSIQKKYISRSVLITDKSIMESEKEHLTLLLYPPENEKNPITIIEMGTLTGTCPKGLYLVHLISRQVTNPKEDFKNCIENLFGDIEEADKKENPTSKPKVLFSCFFSIPDTNDCPLNVENRNMFLCGTPDIDLDYDNSVRQAREIFSNLYPGEEFLPRAPDPEEIVIEGYDSEEVVENVETVNIAEDNKNNGDILSSESEKDESSEKKEAIDEKGDSEKK